MKNRWKYVGRQLAWLALIALAAVILFCLGMAFGYGGLGSGKNPWEILSPSTWQEIFAKFKGQ